MRYIRWVIIAVLLSLLVEVAHPDKLLSSLSVAEPYKADWIYVTLKNDTAPGGVRNNDGITYDPTIKGRLLRRKEVQKITARFHGNRSFADITSIITANGDLHLDRGELERINGGPLEDGSYALRLEAEDQDGGRLGSTDIGFTLDTTPPNLVLFDPGNGGITNLDLGFIDVAILDSSQIELTTISPDNLIIGNENTTLYAASAKRTSDGLFRYYYKGKLSEGSVRVTFARKQISDIAGNVNAQQTQIFEFVSFQPTFNGIPQRPRRIQIEPNINPPHNEDSGGSVYLHSGEAFLRRVDFEIPGRGFNWRFERTYRSGWFNYETPLGNNWDFNYNRRLLVVEPATTDLAIFTAKKCKLIYSFRNCKVGDVVRVDGEGREDLYSRIPSTTKFVSPSGFYMSLTQEGELFVERDRHGNAITYQPVIGGGVMRPMTSFTDRNGNTMRFEYNDGQLKFVIDTLDRRIEYFYEDKLLAKVLDFSGREIVFDYDNNRNLISVTSPTVKNTPHGNDFPEGKTEKYTYDTSSHPYLNHNLLTITAPNEVARGGPPREVYEYNDDDRVIEQIYGGTNNSDVPAGGKFRYTYHYQTPTHFALRRLTNEGYSDILEYPKIPTTFVTDRNGNVTKYQFNQSGNWNRTEEFTNREIRKSDPGAYITGHQHDGDGQRLTVTYHEGNSIQYTFDVNNEDRLQQGNLLQVTRRPDSDRNGDQTEVVTTYSYEPIYNQRRTMTEARGHDSNYRPAIMLTEEEFPNNSRYTTTYTFDYQEGSNFAALATKVGTTAAEIDLRLTKAGIPMALGDVNGDGRTDQVGGNVVRIEHPTVNLLPGANQARIEGGTTQEVVELFVYNDFGQLIRETDSEGNVTSYRYYLERDPDGDGTINGNPASCLRGGYLQQKIQDALSDPSRNSGTNPPPTRIRTSYKYDPVGHVTRTIDGQGIATDYVVNELNQVVRLVRAVERLSPNFDEEFIPGCGYLPIPLLVAPPATDVPVSIPALEASVSSKEFGYIERFWYDHNDNLVLHQKEDRGNTANVDGNPPNLSSIPLGNIPDPIGGRAFADELYKYDILDNPIETIQEVENGTFPHFLRTRFRYDANENLAVTIFPEGNANRTIYDERDLVFRQSRGVRAPELRALEAGSVTAVTIPSTGMVNASASWDPDQWVGHSVRITEGSGVDQFRRILSNTRTILTVSPAWDIPPDATSAYEIGITFSLLHPNDPIDYNVRGGFACDCQSYAYDGNRNAIETVDAADTDLSSDNNNPELGPGDRTRYIYDGFDRRVSAIDSIGNQIVYQYDPGGNKVRELHFGPIGGPSPTSDGGDAFPEPVSIDGVIQSINLVNSNLLSSIEYLYDELNRRFQTDQVLFVNSLPTVRMPNVADGATDLGKKNLTPGDNQAIPGVGEITIEGRVSTRTEFDRKSRATFVVEDDRDTFRTFYDGVGRAIKTVDPEGNTAEAAYDDNHNLIEQRQIDISQEVAGGGGTLQSGVSTGSNDARALKDTTQSWRPFEWAGRTLQITGGTGAGQTRRIIGNTSNQLTVGDQDWEVIPNNTSTYTILPIALLDFGRSTGFNTSVTLNDATKVLADHEWIGQMVEITGGTGAEQIRRITGTNAFQLFVDSAWDVIPDDTSRYAIYPRSQPGITEVFLTTYVYDTLDRLQRQTTNLGQTLNYRYDSRNNLVATADAQGPVSGATTHRLFSNGPLTVNAINEFGNVTLYYYDGINRRTRQEAILTASGLGDGVHIGASMRGVKNEPDAPESFMPAADTTQAGGDGIIRIGTTYDDNSLSSAQIDDQGNVTLYLYDNLDRRVTETKGLTSRTDPLTKTLILGGREIVTPDAMTIDDPRVISTEKINTQLADARARLDAIASLFPSLADHVDDNPPTTVVYGHDGDSNTLFFEDENDTEVFAKYDAINRPIAVRVFRAGQADNHGGNPLFAPSPVSDPANSSNVFPSVVGTTDQNYQYDGLSRLIVATDNNDPASDSDDSTITFVFDSLNRLIEERQQIGAFAPKVISTGWQADNLRSALTFPNGRMIKYSYDDLDRINTIADDGDAESLVEYKYIGRYRVLEQLYPISDTKMTHLDDSGTMDVGYDGLRRQTQLRHLRTDNSLIVGFSHTYDRMNNKLTEEKLHAAVDSELYRYDSYYRLVQFGRGTLNASKDTIDVPSTNSPQHSTWNLDGVGNWTSVDSDTREHSNFNEITARDVDGTLVGLAHDDNGDLTDDGTNTYDWDFNNRLRRVQLKAGGQTIANYSYDAAGRRTHKVVINSGPLDEATIYYYDGQRVIEEQDEAERLSQQYVYGNYIDEVLVMDRNLDADDSATGSGDQRLFYHQNDLMNVYALSDNTATIVEGYLYDAYGQHTVYKPGNSGFVEFGSDDNIAANAQSEMGNPYFLTGRRLDSETGFFYYRARYFDPDLGRFSSRDPIGIWGDMGNVGNGYAYVGNNPLNRVDPLGLADEDDDSDEEDDWIEKCTKDPEGPGCEVVEIEGCFPGYRMIEGECWMELDGPGGPRIRDELRTLTYVSAWSVAGLTYRIKKMDKELAQIAEFRKLIEQLEKLKKELDEGVKEKEKLQRKLESFNLVGCIAASAAMGGACSAAVVKLGLNPKADSACAIAAGAYYGTCGF